MRDIFVLSAAIKKIIPVPHRNDVIVRIDALEREFRRKPPEIWRDWYREMSNLLTDTVGIPDGEAWKEEIVNIFTGRKDVGAGQDEKK